MVLFLDFLTPIVLYFDFLYFYVHTHYIISWLSAFHCYSLQWASIKHVFSRCFSHFKLHIFCYTFDCFFFFTFHVYIETLCFSSFSCTLHLTITARLPEHSYTLQPCDLVFLFAKVEKSSFFEKKFQFHSFPNLKGYPPNIQVARWGQ